MNRADELDRILEAVISRSPEPPTQADDPDRPLACDSLERIELVLQLEALTGATLTDDDAEALVTVGDVRRLLARRMRRLA